MPVITTTYYGVEGSGKTLREAKADAARQIEQALKGSYTPTIIAHRGWAHLIYREPTGWHYRNIVTPEGAREGQVWGSRAATYEEAVAAVQSDLAQLGWQPEDGQTPPEFLKDRKQVSDFRSWTRFQLRYRKVRELGLADSNRCHEIACGWLPPDADAASLALLAQVDAFYPS